MKQSRPTLGALITNWQRRDLGLGVKLRMQVKNTWLRLKRRSNCCGNHGEPGC